MKNPLKGIVIHRGGKIILAVFSLAVLFIAARSCGWMPQMESTPGPAISDALLSENRRKEGLHVAIYPGALFAPGVIENDGLSAGKHSRYRSGHGLNVDFEIIEDADRCFEGLASGDYDIIWATPDSLALRYPRAGAANPMVFFHAGYSRGTMAVVADASINSPFSFKGKTIACVENSSGHFFILYLLSVSGLSSSDMTWKFALTPDDAAYLFENKRADLCAGETDRLVQAVRHRGGSAILLSTRDAARLVPAVFITRESLVLLHKDLLEKFIAGWLEGIETMQSDGDPVLQLPAQAFRMTPGELVREAKLVRPAAYADNLSFFDLTEEEAAGYGFLFDTVSGLWMGEGKLKSAIPSGIIKTSEIILSLKERFGKTGRKTAPEFSFQRAGALQPGGLRLLTGSFRLYFDKNSPSPDFESRVQLKKIADIAPVLASSYIMLRAAEDPGEDPWLGLGQRRLQEIVTILTGEYKIKSERIFTGGKDFAFPGTQPAHSRRVDLIFVSPDKL